VQGEAVRGPADTGAPRQRGLAAAARRGLAGVARRSLEQVPAEPRVLAKQLAWRLRTAGSRRRVLDQFAPDLLFCPFTAPYYWRPGLRMVAIVYDLQHVVFPQFFPDEQRLNRERHVHQVVRHAQRVVSISQYVRDRLVEAYPAVGPRCVAIPLGLLQPCQASTPVGPVLRRLGLADGEYLLYPANFWPHKNHARLFEALRRLGTRRTLVCTGAPNALTGELRACADALLGAGAVLFPGYLPAADLTALLQGCAAVVYPSLYEGFGLPVLEAMALGRPVVCSKVASLPEVAGEAAVYCDPTDPDDIARALSALDANPALIPAQVARGQARARTFGTAREMAERYLAVFNEVMPRP